MCSRKRVLKGVVVLAATGLVVPALHVMKGTPPKKVGSASLFLETVYRDVGITTPGNHVEVQYELRNLGEALLKISDLRTSCGCAPASISVDDIRPNGQALITVSYLVPQAPGVYSHAIWFKTNDQDNPHMSLGFRCRAAWPVEISPAKLFIGVLNPESEEIRDVEVYSPGESVFHVSDIVCSAPWIKVEEVHSSSRYRHHYRIRMRAPPQQGEFTETIQFTTDISERPFVQLSISGEVVCGQRIVPKMIMLGECQKGTIAKTRLIIRSIKDTIPNVREVTIGNDDWRIIGWKVSSTSASRTAIVTIDIQVPTISGYKRSVLRVRCGTEDKPLEVPISGVIGF